LQVSNAACNWIRSIELGTLPVETLEEQIQDLPFTALKALVSASKAGTIAQRRRAVAILAYFRGISANHISSFLNVSRSSVLRYSRTYKAGGLTALLNRKPRSDKKSNNDAIKAAVFALLHSPPAAHDINRTTWRLEDLRRVLLDECRHPVGTESISTIIKEAGWTWRRARVVLTSHDPEYREKVEAIKRILSHLEPNEAFFSIDEFGPFAIKRKGGRKRVGPGEPYVIPQWQKSKGCMIITAAL
jgi:transposase